MPEQDPPFFVIAEGVRLLGPYPNRDAADRAALDWMCDEVHADRGVCAVTLSAAELAILRDRLVMMELRS